MTEEVKDKRKCVEYLVINDEELGCNVKGSHKEHKTSGRVSTGFFETKKVKVAWEDQEDD